MGQSSRPSYRTRSCMARAHASRSSRCSRASVTAEGAWCCRECCRRRLGANTPATISTGRRVRVSIPAALSTRLRPYWALCARPARFRRMLALTSARRGSSRLSRGPASAVSTVRICWTKHCPVTMGHCQYSSRGRSYREVRRCRMSDRRWTTGSSARVCSFGAQRHSVLGRCAHCRPLWRQA